MIPLPLPLRERARLVAAVVTLALTAYFAAVLADPTSADPQVAPAVPAQVDPVDPPPDPVPPPDPTDPPNEPAPVEPDPAPTENPNAPSVEPEGPAEPSLPADPAPEPEPEPGPDAPPPSDPNLEPQAESPDPPAEEPGTPGESPRPQLPTRQLSQVAPTDTADPVERPAPGSPTAPADTPGTGAQPGTPQGESPAGQNGRGVSGRGHVVGGPHGPNLTSTAIGPAVADAGSEAAVDAAPVSVTSDSGDATGAVEANKPPSDSTEGLGASVTQTVSEIVEVVPDTVKVALAGLAALSLILAGASFLTAGHARRLERQREELLQEVGLLQTALLPPVPARLGALHTSVAYRPAEGPGAGGDFYDALLLPGGKVAFILGDVSGHGRAALPQTAFLRYTLRAYLEAGLEPRTALQVAGRVIDEHLDGDFATVVLAIHDPETASLTFACAGHPAPIVVGPSAYEPVLPASSPPLGIGLRTGLRQTTIPLAPGSVACLFTDGLTEARTEGGILGRPRLGDILARLGRDANASRLLETLADEARLVTDDMAAVLLSPTAGVTAGGFRVEQLELSEAEIEGNVARRFLEACGVAGGVAAAAEIDAAQMVRGYGGAVVNVSYGNREPVVEVLPRNVENIAAAAAR